MKLLAVDDHVKVSGDQFAKDREGCGVIEHCMVGEAGQFQDRVIAFLADDGESGKGQAALKCLNNGQEHEHIANAPGPDEQDVPDGTGIRIRAEFWAFKQMA